MPHFASTGDIYCNFFANEVVELCSGLHNGLLCLYHLKQLAARRNTAKPSAEYLAEKTAHAAEATGNGQGRFRKHYR